MLACGSMGAEIQALLYLVVACWGLTAVLAIPNLLLIASTNMTDRLRVTQLGVFVICGVLTIVLFNGGFSQSFWSVALAAFGIPGLVMCQFGSLLILRRRLRAQSETLETHDT